MTRGYGGIGRRARFRFWCLRRAGSSPVIRIYDDFSTFVKARRTALARGAAEHGMTGRARIFISSRRYEREMSGGLMSLFSLCKGQKRGGKEQI